jgi:hypothetical protein
MKYLSKAQAIAILSLVVGRNAGEDCADSLLRDVRAGREVIPWYAPDGCKVGACKRGAVVRFYLAGYAWDGSDVARCMARIGA